MDKCERKNKWEKKDKRRKRRRLVRTPREGEGATKES